MGAEPIVIYSQRIDPAGVLCLLRELVPDLEVEGSGEEWTRATVRGKAGFLRKRPTLSFGHHRDYYAGADWPKQVLGMMGYLARFPRSADTPRIMLLAQSFRFALSLFPMPEPELYIDSDDPRLHYVFAVARHLDGALFLPSGLRDASGRMLYGSGERDPRAVMPGIYREVGRRPRAERLRSEGGTRPDPDDEPPPTAVRVARRACALAAVSGRALLEQDGPEDPEALQMRQDILAWVEEIGVADELEPAELALLQAPLGSPTRQATLNATWRLEGLAVLAWALRRGELPPHDRLVVPRDLLHSVGILDAQAARDLLAAPSLRPAEDLASQRDRQFAIHWRLTNWRIAPKAMNFAEFARTAWFGPLDISGLRLLEDDMAVGDAPLARASPEAIDTAASAAMERHLAANWLNGGSELYSEADVST